MTRRNRRAEVHFFLSREEISRKHEKETQEAPQEAPFPLDLPHLLAKVGRMVTLESNRLFRQLSEADVSRLKSSAHELKFAPQEIIFKEGDSGDGVYFIKSGKVSISSVLNSSEQRIFTRIGPGEFFGEMAVLDNEPRSASAIAEEACVLYFIPRQSILSLLEKSPQLALLLLKEISQRMREFNRHYIREVLQGERLALVGRFARSIVHDLKNPLNIIGLAAELACQDAPSPESRRTTKERIHKQVERISAMVNEILDFTTSSSASMVLATTDYRSFVNQLVEEIRPEIALKSAQLVVPEAPPSVPVGLNPKRLCRVFYNLIHNATDAMPEGGDIFIRFKVDGNEVLTEIEDSGKGIPPEIQGQLFEAFVTYGKAHGTGMGLSICKKIVEDHRGKISARNSPRGGAIFSFTLPIQRN